MTDAEVQISLESCRVCAAAWLARRGFCAHCGAADVVEKAVLAKGTVWSATMVHIGAAPPTGMAFPYAISLIKLDHASEVTIMAISATLPAAGDHVAIRNPAPHDTAPYFVANP
jgi:uncharacterized OB-fold protein